MTKTFNNISEVKNYVREFNNPDRFEVKVDGEIPSNEDVETISWREREGLAHNFEYVEIQYKDFYGNVKTTTITITKNVGCMF